MKRLALALLSLSLVACGNTAKEDVPAYDGTGNRGQESQDDFAERCAGRNGSPRGRLINNGTFCLISAKTVALSGPLPENTHNLGSLKTGAVVYGSSRDGIPVELSLNGRPISRGDVAPYYYLPEDGDLVLRVYAGTYDGILYQSFYCSARNSNNSVPCPNPIN